MSLFVDTGVFYAHHDRDASRHFPATEALEQALSGRYGSVFTSDYVFGETVALTRSRMASYSDTLALVDRILGREPFARAVDLLFVSEDHFQRAVGAFERYHDHQLSFTDATTITLMDVHGIDYLLSFDADFDGIVDRLDPDEVASGSD